MRRQFEPLTPDEKESRRSAREAGCLSEKRRKKRGKKRQKAAREQLRRREKHPQKCP